MPNLTVRNVPVTVHRALKARAARHGRSTEAEVREILRHAAEPAGGLRFGDELAALGASFGGLDLTVRRTRKPMRRASFA